LVAYASNNEGSAKVKCSSCCSRTEGMVYSVGGLLIGDPAAENSTRFASGEGGITLKISCAA
jgi:hypothetical protein